MPEAADLACSRRHRLRGASSTRRFDSSEMRSSSAIRIQLDTSDDPP